MSAEQDEAAVRAELAQAATGTRRVTLTADELRRLLADLDAAEHIARLAEESEAGWRREEWVTRSTPEASKERFRPGRFLLCRASPLPAGPPCAP